jgi:hypothetical protein
MEQSRNKKAEQLILLLLQERGEMAAQEICDMMFLIDLAAYKKLGKTITCLEYTRGG